MKNHRFTALALGISLGASLIAAPATAQDSPVVGTWNTEAVTDFGTFAATMIVSEAEDGYAVEIIDQAPEGGAPAGGAAPAMESTISDVSVDGSEFSFKRSMTTPQGAMEISYTGNVEGDSMTASANTDFGAIPVTGTRAEEE